MINPVNNIQQCNYNIILPKKSINKHNATFCGENTSVSVANNQKNPIRTELSSKIEMDQYSKLLNMVDKSTRKNLEQLLKSGILLNNESNDNSTVLQNLYDIATKPRAKGLDNIDILKSTINTVASPYLITQQFGDIPNSYRKEVININNSTKPEDTPYIDVEHSGTCVAASIEFNLAQKTPAEFARFAQNLSSPKLSVDKTIQLKNLADSWLEAATLLNIFKLPYKVENSNSAKLTFAPDKNAIVRATIQTTNKDSLERSALDVLMQSTFMQTGSQQTYNTITDKRETNEFNPNNRGLIEFEKTFTESVVADKNKLSIVYQTVDNNSKLVGWEKDFETIKRHLTSTLDSGENVIIGYTQVDSNNIIINGHEITVVGYKKDRNNKLTFICNDTDDDKTKPVEYSEDFLIPKIHHAALPQNILKSEIDNTPNWVFGLEAYQQMRKGA